MSIAKRIIERLRRFTNRLESTAEATKQAAAVRVDTDDTLVREAVSLCYTTGHIVIGNRDESGRVTLKTVDK